MGKYCVVVHRSDDDTPYFVDFCEESKVYDDIYTEYYSKWRSISNKYGCNRQVIFTGLTKGQAKGQSRILISKFLKTGETSTRFLCNDLRYALKIEKSKELINLYNEGYDFRTIAHIIGIHESNVYRRLNAIYNIKRNVPEEHLNNMDINELKQNYMISRSKVYMYKKLNTDTTYYIKRIDLSKWGV